MQEQEQGNEEAPLTMAASVILSHLPKDAKGALEGVEGGRGLPEKGMSILVLLYVPLSERPRDSRVLSRLAYTFRRLLALFFL